MQGGSKAGYESKDSCVFEAESVHTAFSVTIHMARGTSVNGHVHVSVD